MSEERDLLSCRKRVIELELELAKNLSKHSNQVSTLSNDLSNTQQENVNLSLKVQTLIKNVFEKQEEMTRMKAEVSDAKAEVSSVVSNHGRINKKFREALQRNEELGLELINLLNTKASLLDERAKHQLELETLSKHNVFLEKRIKSIESDHSWNKPELRQSMPALFLEPIKRVEISSGDTDVLQERILELETQLRDERERISQHSTRLENERASLLEEIDRLRRDLSTSKDRKESIKPLSTLPSMESNDRVKVLEDRANDLLRENLRMGDEYRSQIIKMMKETASLRYPDSDPNEILNSQFASVLATYQRHEDQLLKQLSLKIVL